MNAVLEPSLIFLPEHEWTDEEKKDEFLDLLMDLLNYINSEVDIKIYWTDGLEGALWEQPNLPPWRVDKDFSNQFVPVLHKLFHSNIEIIEEQYDLNSCIIEPNLEYDRENQNVINLFLKLMHNLISMKENIYLCASGVNNKQFRLSCSCHSHVIEPAIVTRVSDFINVDEIISINWPLTRQEGGKLYEIINSVREVQEERKPLLYTYCFDDDFVKDLVVIRNRRKNIISQIIKRLTLTSEGARRDSTLQDEYIGQVKEYRFRVTSRPSSIRIHYIIDKKEIKFLRCYDEGHHDDAL